MTSKLPKQMDVRILNMHMIVDTISFLQYVDGRWICGCEW